MFVRVWLRPDGLRPMAVRWFSIEEAVRVLFEGLAQEKLYIGPIEFQKQSPKILDVIQKRAENIVKELNPEHPRDIGPTKPVCKSGII